MLCPGLRPHTTFTSDKYAFVEEDEHYDSHAILFNSVLASQHLKTISLPISASEFFGSNVKFYCNLQ